MKAKKTILYLTLSVLIFLLAGCSALEEPIEVILEPRPVEQPYNAPAPNRFQQTSQKGPTAVEGAIELAKEHAKLTEEMAAMRQKNQNLIAENTTLKNHLAESERQLQQTQNELTQANELLREMVIELNNWKVSVLGFQNEIRQTDKAQMEALLKILNVLGGEVKTQSTQNQNAPSTEASTNDPNNSQPQSRPAAKNAGAQNE